MPGLLLISSIHDGYAGVRRSEGTPLTQEQEKDGMSLLYVIDIHCVRAFFPLCFFSMFYFSFLFLENRSLLVTDCDVHISYTALYLFYTTLPLISHYYVVNAES